MLGQRFDLRTYPHKAVELRDEAADAVHKTVSDRLSTLWKPAAIAGFIGGVIVAADTGQAIPVGVAFSAVGAVGAGMTAVSRPDSEKKDVTKVLNTEISKVYPSFQSTSMLGEW